MPASLVDKIFGIVQSKSKYDGIGKTSKILEFFQDNIMGDSNPNLVIHAYNITKREVEFFTSTKHTDALVREVIDTSSAAPVYFPPVKLGEDWYIDGGVCANDPSMVGLSEAMALWGDEVPIRILSIGTGNSTKPIDGEKAKQNEWGALQWFSEGQFIDICLDSSVASLQAKKYIRK